MADFEADALVLAAELGELNDAEHLPCYILTVQIWVYDCCQITMPVYICMTS